MALNLTTRADYKTYAGIKSTNYDAEIDALLPKVSTLVKNYCGRTFVDYWNVTKTEYFDGGFPTFILKETPLVGTPVVSTSEDYGTTWTALTAGTDYIVKSEPFPQIVSLHSSRNFPEKLNGYKVAYTGGYDDVPDDLELAVMDLITYYRRNDASVHSTKAPGTNSVQVEYISTTSIPAHIRRVLDLHRADFN